MKLVGEASTMREAGERLVAIARDLAPIDTSEHSSPPKHPGALKTSIQVVYAVPRAVGVTAGGPTAPYAASIEFGARDHPIDASRAPNLAFFWKYKNPPKGKPTYFKGKRVSHPGNAPQPFFFPALAAMAGKTGVAGYFRSVPTKTITLVDAIRVDLVNHWNAGA